jgi:transglutaminase-like putative cysteine protease
VLIAQNSFAPASVGGPEFFGGVGTCSISLGDIGVPLDDAPMDFSAWFEAYLGGRWYTFDARHNKPRIGRILMARGRDATDVAIVTSFCPAKLAGFKVMTDEVGLARDV